MNFSLDKSVEILERTPVVLEKLLLGISDDWTLSNEGENTFSPYDVIGHLIEGEKTDWIIRLDVILSDTENKEFKPYDRFAQYENSKGKSLSELLEEFKMLRSRNLSYLRAKNLREMELDMTGIHPKFGNVTLRQLISTWTVHDLSHIAQIARVMCKQYFEEVGPWTEYLPILTRK